MANCLHRDLNKNEVIVLQSKYLKLKEPKFYQRLFCCISGFGMYKDTAPKDTFIWGYFLDIGEPVTVSGLHIDIARTNAIRQNKDVHDMVAFLNRSFHRDQAKFFLPEELSKELQR